MTSLFGALLGAAMGSGAFAAVMGWRGFPSPSTRGGLKLLKRLLEPPTSLALRLTIAVAGTLAATVVTGWLVVGFIAGTAGFISPTILRAKSNRGRELERMTALATWVEMVRDTIGAASGLTESLQATAATAPRVLRRPVRQLAARAERVALPDALAKFADEVDHAVADTVAVTLSLAATNQVGSVQETLAQLAESTRQEVSMRLRVEASRARQFASARFIAGVVAVFSVGMVSFSRSYLAPFDTASGQVALAVIGGLFIGSGVALMKMSRFSNPPRILDVGRVPASPNAATGLAP